MIDKITLQNVLHLIEKQYEAEAQLNNALVLLNQDNQTYCVSSNIKQAVDQLLEFAIGSESNYELLLWYAWEKDFGKEPCMAKHGWESELKDISNFDDFYQFLIQEDNIDK